MGKWPALRVGGGLVRSTRPGSKILLGGGAASIHCTGGSALFYNKRPPAPDEKYLIIGDGKKMEVEFSVCVDVVMHCVEDAAVTLRDVAFVPGVPFDLCSFYVIQRGGRPYPIPRRGRTCSMNACFYARRSSANTLRPLK